MKIILTISLLSSAIIFSIGCKKTNDFISSNVIETGVGFAPISNNTLQDISANPIKNLASSSTSATSYAAGATFKTELTFFSKSLIKETNLYNTIGTGSRTLVTSTPYAPAFSISKGLDTLLVPYTIPSVAAGTIIKLEYEIKNANSLKAIRTVYVKRT